MGAIQYPAHFFSLPYLTTAFQLSRFEQECVLLCLASEINLKYEKLYGFLQDDITCKHPTVDTALKLLCTTPEDMLAARAAFLEGSNLHRFFLKKETWNERSGSLLSRTLCLDERIVSFLLYVTKNNAQISSFSQNVFSWDALPPLLTGEEIQTRIRMFVDEVGIKYAEKPVLFYIWGQTGAGKKLQVRHACQYLGVSIVLVDLKYLVEAEQPLQEALEQVLREVILQQGALCLEHVDVLLGDEGQQKKRLQAVKDLLRDFRGLVFLLAERRANPHLLFPQYACTEIELPVPSELERMFLWETYAKAYLVDEELDFRALASKFHFTPGRIQNALSTAHNLTKWHFPDSEKISQAEIYTGCYAQVQHRLGELGTRLQPKYSWDDIILPDEQKAMMRNACNQIKYRSIVYSEWGFGRKLSYGKGLSMLFSGPPGTGKTMSAEVIANELHLEIYKVDLSRIVSKYIGETEKNLQQIFEEAQLSHAILFFDEMDALFGKRSEVKDSHDKYANLETSFLLQKMEEYEGITVLATNYLQNIDEAFMRRITYIVKFPFPDAGYREAIWRHMFPAETPLDPDVDFKFLADKLQLAGGHIKNMAVSAAFLAAEAGECVRMKHILEAAKHELSKTGKIFLQGDVSEFY